MNHNIIEFPSLDDWNPHWNKQRDLANDRTEKKRILIDACKKLIGLESTEPKDLPKLITVKSGTFSMKLTPQRAVRNGLMHLLLKLPQKAARLWDKRIPEPKTPKPKTPYCLYRDDTQAALEIYGTPENALNRLRWQLAHAKELDLDEPTTRLVFADRIGWPVPLM